MTKPTNTCPNKKNIPIQFMQYNIHRQDVIYQTALQQAYEDGIDILLLQEPYFTKITY